MIIKETIKDPNNGAIYAFRECYYFIIDNTAHYIEINTRSKVAQVVRFTNSNLGMNSIREDFFNYHIIKVNVTNNLLNNLSSNDSTTRDLTLAILNSYPIKKCNVKDNIIDTLKYYTKKNKQ